MSFGNSQRYDAYTEGGILSCDPLSLVVVLYEGAVQALDDAAACLRAGDFAGRARHVAKAVRIINELLVSLRDDAGGDISQNLRRLYMYMQGQLLRRDCQNDLAVLNEVRSLLATLLDGWRTISGEKLEAPTHNQEQYIPENLCSAEEGRYGGYLMEDDGCRLVASF